MSSFDKSYQEVVRRAELLDRIQSILNAANLSTVQNVQEGARPHDLGPKLAIVGYGVLCDGHTLDLSRRPLSLKLFAAFLESPGLSLTLEGVIEALYGPLDPTLHSRRFRSSLRVNAVKAVSRARNLAEAAFAHAEGVEWMSHDRGRWYLYKLAPRMDVRLTSQG